MPCDTGSGFVASQLGRAILATTPRRQRRIKNFAELVSAAIASEARDKPVELWSPSLFSNRTTETELPQALMKWLDRAVAAALREYGDRL